MFFFLDFNSYIEIDDLQFKIIVTDKVMRLDISMCYFVLVEISEPLDEAPAELDTTADATSVHK